MAVILDQELKQPQLGDAQWQNYCRRELAPGFDAFKQKVLEQNQWRCYHCGFVAKKHMHVMNKDGNYFNNQIKNLYAACPLCFWSCNLAYANASGHNRGVLIYMPEMTQSHINGLMHSIFCSVAGATLHEGTSEVIHKTMKLRAKVVEDMYGEGRSDPTAFGHMLINAMNIDAKIPEKLLENIRFLPNMLGFIDEVKDWSQDAASDNQ